jgi:hypothetical protein
MSVLQDHADAFLALLRAAPPASPAPSLVVYDGEVPPGPEVAYALIYFWFETPDGLVAPDAVSLVLDSDVIDAWANVHSVGADPQAARAARAVATRVRAGVLNKTLTIPGRSCNPIRQRTSQPPHRDEDTGPTVMDQVDEYSWRSFPA